MQGYELTFKDAAGKLGRSTVHTGPINALTLGIVSGQALTYRNAVFGVTGTPGIAVGHCAREVLAAYNNQISDVIPTNKNARKVLRWKITHVDTQQYMDTPIDAILNPYYNVNLINTIPTANPALCIAGTNDVDLTTGPWPAFIAAFHNLVCSPSGFSTTVTKIELIDK